jgi:hypothetical protein
MSAMTGEKTRRYAINAADPVERHDGGPGRSHAAAWQNGGIDFMVEKRLRNIVNAADPDDHDDVALRSSLAAVMATQSGFNFDAEPRLRAIVNAADPDDQDDIDSRRLLTDELRRLGFDFVAELAGRVVVLH